MYLPTLSNDKLAIPTDLPYRLLLTHNLSKITKHHIQAIVVSNVVIKHNGVFYQSNLGWENKDAVQPKNSVFRVKKHLDNYHEDKAFFFFLINHHPAELTS